MRISSDYYDYYSQSYALNSLSNAKISSGNSNSSQNETEAISFQPRRHSAVSGNDNLMNLSSSGKMMRDSLQMQGKDSSEISEKMEQIKTDMDSIKTADIDGMSADDVKTALTNLQNDFKAMPSPDGSANDIQQADISSMSESEMREMLKEVQEKAKNAPEMGEGMPPPPPPMMGGFDPSQMLNGMFGSQSDTDSVNSSSDTQSILQQIIDNITESYDSSTESSDDYVAKLKESISSMFSEQKNSIDDFSKMIFSELDDWNTQEKTKTQET